MVRKLIAVLAFLVTLYGCDVDSVIKTEKLTSNVSAEVERVYYETFDGGDALVGGIVGYTIGGDLTWGVAGGAIAGTAGAGGCTVETERNGIPMDFDNLAPSVCATLKPGDIVDIVETRTIYTYESGKREQGWYTERRLVQ